MRRATALGWTPVEHLGTPHFVLQLLQLCVPAQIQEHQPSLLVFLPNRLALVNNFALILYEKHMGRQIIRNSRLYPRPTLRKINHSAGNSCWLLTAEVEVRLDGHLFTSMSSPVAHGGAIVDTPGLRSLEVWNAPEGNKDNFDDVQALATQCRFRDCRHDSEPACAVRAAVRRGDLDAGRFASYVKLGRAPLRVAR
jgi:hypothetical protein